MKPIIILLVHFVVTLIGVLIAYRISKSAAEQASREVFESHRSETTCFKSKSSSPETGPSNGSDA